MVCKEIRQPVVYRPMVSEVELGKFLKESSVSESVKRLGEIERQDDDIRFSGQQINNSV